MKIHFIFEDFCSPLMIDHGGVNYYPSGMNGRYSIETAALVTCNYGYFRSGSQTRICQTGGTWDGQTICNQSKLITLRYNYINYVIIYIY